MAAGPCPTPPISSLQTPKNPGFYPFSRFGARLASTAMLGRMGRTVRQAVFELLTSLPETEEARAHGKPVFKVAGRTYAYWTRNHHGDGRIAIWLGTPADLQAQLVGQNPEAYFVPPYVGVKGYVGVELDKGLAWSAIADSVHAAWVHTAPASVDTGNAAIPTVAPPDIPLKPEDINPMLGAREQEVLAGLAERCANLPETVPEDAARSATWRAGKRAFVRGRHDEGRLKLMFLVGAEQQAMMLDDPRFGQPPYYGPSGWIDLDVQTHLHWPEIEGLLETAYRYVALKRMLQALEANPPW